jgi:hypothetical protein
MEWFRRGGNARQRRKLRNVFRALERAGGVAREVERSVATHPSPCRYQAHDSVRGRWLAVGAPRSARLLHVKAAVAGFDETVCAIGCEPGRHEREEPVAVRLRCERIEGTFDAAGSARVMTHRGADYK